MRVSIGRARRLGVGAVAKRRSTGLSDYESALVSIFVYAKYRRRFGARTAADLNVSVVNRSDLVSKLNLGVTRYGDAAIEAYALPTLDL